MTGERRRQRCRRGPRAGAACLHAGRSGVLSPFRGTTDCEEATMASRNLEAFRRLMEQGEFEDDITSERSRKAMYEAYTDDFTVVEPPSLPHGGVWSGRDEWLKMNAMMRDRWAQKVRADKIWDLPEENLVILYSDMEWTANDTGKTVSFPAIELLYFRDEKICRVEMFLQDTKAILDTLEL
jgi:hypothetical protein